MNAIQRIAALLRGGRNGSDTWMTLNELADETGVSYAALRQAAWDGRLRGARKSKHLWLATPEIVDRAIERGDMRRRG